MITCREEALRWVHRYAVGGAVFAAIPLPISVSPLLAALETHMFGVIGQVYGDVPGAPATAAAGGTFIAVGGGLKAAASQATKLIPVVGPLIHASIAAATIEGMGHAIVAHFERKFPGKNFTEPVK